jgi:DNA-binding GntR family transcriptional regulator
LRDRSGFIDPDIRQKTDDETTREHIYRVLKEDIIYLRLIPGEIISENDISRRFSVSRTPVRDVFSKLQIDNLIEVRPQRGTFVSLIDFEYVKDIVYMRNVVETQLFTELIDVITKEQINNLKANLEGQRRAIDMIVNGTSELEFFEIDSEFHRYAYSILGRSKLWEVIQQLKVHYTRFRMLDLVKTKDFGTLHKEHCKIVELIEQKDKAAIATTMKEHLYGGINRLSDKIKDEYKGYFV